MSTVTPCHDLAPSPMTGSLHTYRVGGQGTPYLSSVCERLDVRLHGWHDLAWEVSQRHHSWVCATVLVHTYLHSLLVCRLFLLLHVSRGFGTIRAMYVWWPATISRYLGRAGSLIPRRRLRGGYRALLFLFLSQQPRVCMCVGEAGPLS